MRRVFTSFSLALAVALGGCGKESENTKTVDPQIASGGKLKLSGNAGSVSGVPIASEAVFTSKGKETRMRLTGAGLREKSVLLVTVDVYVIASYVDSPTGISRTNPLQSLKQSKSRLLVMTLLRDVTGEQMRDAFQTAAAANGMASDPQLNQLVGKLTVNLAEGAKVALFSQTGTGNVDTVSIYGPGTYSFSGVDLGYKLWKLWFGTPVDDQGAELQGNLLSVQ